MILGAGPVQVPCKFLESKPRAGRRSLACNGGEPLPELSQVILQKLINRYFDTAFLWSEEGKPLDVGCMDAFKQRGGDLKSRSMGVRKYIDSYSATRGLNSQFVKDISIEAIKYFDGRDDLSDKTSVPKNFANLYCLIVGRYVDEKKTERRFLSLTSKWLAMAMPDLAPIYDAQAYATLVFLTKIHKSLEGWPPHERGSDVQGTSPELDAIWGKWNELSAEQRDNYWYQDYLWTHQFFLEMCRPEIECRLRGLGAAFDWLSPERFFDKFLWVVGTESYDYSLMTKADPSFRERLGPPVQRRNEALAR
jgi:hypothetical protein